MGFIDRLTQRANAYDEFEDEFDEQELAPYDEYEEESEGSVSPIHPVRSTEVARIVTVWVSSYKEIRDFAVEYRDGLPVILNLSKAADAERARIVDFALGLCFGLDGNFSRISDDVFLLTPHAVKLESHGENEVHDFSR